MGEEADQKVSFRRGDP